MKLTYETGIATFAQFIVVSLLNILTGTSSIVTTCHSKGQNCLTNSLSSVGYFMLIVIWFGMIWILGYFAQKRRSSRLSFLLIGAEVLITVIALFNANHNHKDLLGLITSLIDAGFGLWVALLAVRLLRARGGRIVASERSRKRNRPGTEL